MSVAVIQARMSSQRLPGKVLAEIDGRTMVGRVIEAASASSICEEIIVATSDDSSDEPLVQAIQGETIRIHRGPIDDVLTRFLQALSLHDDETTVIRLTADCPLLDPSVVRMAVRAFEDAQVDYLSTILIRSLPRGLDVEVMTLESLRRVDKFASDYQRSHVTPAIYQNPGRFELAGITFEPRADDLRVTVDTQDDLNAVRAIVAGLGDMAADRRALISFLRSHPEVVGINSAVEQKELEDG